MYLLTYSSKRSEKRRYTRGEDEFLKKRRRQGTKYLNKNSNLLGLSRIGKQKEKRKRKIKSKKEEREKLTLE